jgi:peptidoglycan endopeptidase LytE
MASKFKKDRNISRVKSGPNASVKEVRFQETCTTPFASAEEPVDLPGKNTEDNTNSSNGVLVPWRNKKEQAQLAKLAIAFAGAPYKEGGSTLRGLDCSAFVRKVYEVFGVGLPRQSEKLLARGVAVQKEGLTIGDIVFFAKKDSEANRPHVGVFVGNNRFAHASSYKSKGVMVDSLDSDYGKFYIGAVRVKKQPEGGSE